MTRKDHVEWCKRRALSLLPDLRGAVYSMMSDLTKHPETNSTFGGMLCLAFLKQIEVGTETEESVRKFVEGFN